MRRHRAAHILGPRAALGRLTLAGAIALLSGCQAGPTAPSAAASAPPAPLRLTIAISPNLLLSQGERGCANEGDIRPVWRYQLTLRNDEPEPARLVTLVRLKDATPYGGARDVARLDGTELAAAFGTDTIPPGGDVSAAQCVEGWGGADLTYSITDARVRVATSPVTLMHPGFAVNSVSP